MDAEGLRLIWDYFRRFDDYSVSNVEDGAIASDFLDGYDEPINTFQLKTSFLGVSILEGHI